MNQPYDIVIAGSGFAGSLAALMLHTKGFRVCLLEKGQHPRFAIGESSTPIADMALRDISAQYNLPWLADFSRYGSWQRAHPEVVCGLKRGFSYYKHEPGQPFSTDQNHSHELLVAASANNEQSDTNWLRADVDAFLIEKVNEYGIDYFDHTNIVSAHRKNGQWTVNTVQNGRSIPLTASFFIDATGGGALAEKLFAVRSSADSFQTNSFAVYSHFENLPKWATMLQQRGIPATDYPYNPDDSALHHLLHEGWVWVLRFNNNRTSWGFALDGWNDELNHLSTEQMWQLMLDRYPDIRTILSEAAYAPIPGRTLRSGRLQRRLDTGFGDGWVALPHTIGFVDPLFSSGIAHSLTGLEKVIKLLVNHFDAPDALYNDLKTYEQATFEELKLIDLLVAGCYKAMLYFPLFRAWSMLYFAFTILYEQRRLSNQPVDHFLCADEPLVHDIVNETYRNLLTIVNQSVITEADCDRFTDLVRERIKPLNSVGLLNPTAKNMYWHTVAAF